MHLIRRSALRALSNPSTSFISSGRTITTTSSPFLRNSFKQSQASFAPFARRFASDDVTTETQEPAADVEKSTSSETTSESSPSSADVDDQSSISSAIDSVAESASSYASEAAESLTERATEAKDTISDAAAAAVTSAGLAFAPREYQRESRFSQERSPRRDNERPEYERREPLILAPSNTIYVGNLLFDVTTEDLEREFAQHGKVVGTRLALDYRQLSKGFGYVEFETVDQATAALNARNGTIYEGRRIVVNYQNTTKRAVSKAEPSETLFIGNLAFEMSDSDLNRLFRDIRNVIDVRVAIDRRTGQPRGFAHADFVDVESAAAAKEVLSGKEVYGRALRVDFSGAPTVRSPPREGGFRGDRGGRDGGDRRPRY